MAVDHLAMQALSLAEQVSQKANLMTGQCENTSVIENRAVEQKQSKPKRIVVLAGWIILIVGTIYGINIVCGLILKLTENEHFISQIATVLKRCDPLEKNCTMKNLSFSHVATGNVSVEEATEG
jgi:hypothetical protein